MSARLSFAVGGVAVLLLGGVVCSRLQSPPTRLIFLSVGQGDCALFSHQGVNVLIDVGPKTQGFDAGSRIIAPKLREYGVYQIDLVFLSHPDSDHIGGLKGILQRRRAGKIVVPGHFRDHPDLRLTLKEAGIPTDKITWLDRHQDIQIGEFSFRALVPRWTRDLDDNSGSLMLKLTGPDGAAAVFTGDAPIETEFQAMGRMDWRAQVLKAGHHGSNDSTSKEFLDAVDPKWVVFSAGRDNPFNHPSKGAVQRALDSGAIALRTDQQGDVIFLHGDRGFELGLASRQTR
jgi:competence protein ComEC